MVDLFDKDGNAVDALTPEEVQAKVEEEIAKALEGKEAERQEEIDKAYADLEKAETAKKDLEEKLAKFDDKSVNFKNIKEKVDEKDKKIADLEKNLADLQTGLKKDIEDIKQGAQKQSIQSKILESVGGDKELAAKVEVAYGKFAPGLTPEAINENIQNAIMIATGGKSPKVITSKITDSSGGANIPQKNMGKLSEGVADIAKNFGLTEKDLKKHNLI